jgi:hypothetical protein
MSSLWLWSAGASTHQCVAKVLIAEFSAVFIIGLVGLQFGVIYVETLGDVRMAGQQLQLQCTVFVYLEVFIVCPVGLQFGVVCVETRAQSQVPCSSAVRGLLLPRADRGGRVGVLAAMVMYVVDLSPLSFWVTAGSSHHRLSHVFLGVAQAVQMHSLQVFLRLTQTCSHTHVLRTHVATYAENMELHNLRK